MTILKQSHKDAAIIPLLLRPFQKVDKFAWWVFLSSIAGLSCHLLEAVPVLIHNLLEKAMSFHLPE